MEIIKIVSMKDYTDYLEVHPEEFALLFNHLLINVTSFFRDQPAWDFLQTRGSAQAHQVARGRLDSNLERRLRLRSRKPYSLAILFCRVDGGGGFSTASENLRLRRRSRGTRRSKRTSLLTAPRTSRSSTRKFSTTYFEQVGERFLSASRSAPAVIFGRHDLIGDAPISRLDLLVCRNTLMYFNAETQNRILARFHFALSGAGYLFLGKAEMLLTHANLFNPIELKYRIFMKVANVTLRDRLLLINQIGDEDGGTRLTRQWRMRELAYESVPLAQLVIDYEGNLVLANRSCPSHVLIHRQRF